MMGDAVNLVAGVRPELYHCSCEYCREVIGELRQPDGGHYSRLERGSYYAKEDDGEDRHIARTPLHIARWAVQRYTRPGDWVLDPMIGSGTTAVEAMTQGRNAAGMELEFTKVLVANVRKAKREGVEGIVAAGDARTIKPEFLDKICKSFALVVSNPPYAGDGHRRPVQVNGKWLPERRSLYDEDLPNLAHLKENDEYWRTIEGIYRACVSNLSPGGHFVTGIKDMRKNFKSNFLHKRFCEVLSGIGLSFVGTAFLKHHPTTYDQNLYLKKNNGDPGGVLALYQTISVFRKG